MRDVLLIARQELRVNIRRPSFILMTLLVPAVGLLAQVVFSAFSGQVTQVVTSQFVPTANRVGFVDESGLTSAAEPAERSAYAFVRFADREAAREALLAEEISSYFVLPPDYVQTGVVRVVGIGGGFSTFVSADDDRIASFLIARLLEGKVDPELRARVLEPAKVEPVTLDPSGQVSTESPFNWIGDFVVPYVFSILFVVSLFTTSGFLLQGVTEEKEGRIIEILLSSTTPTRLLAGKILGLGVVGLIQVTVWLGAGVLLLFLAVSVFSVAGFVEIRTSTVVLSLVFAALGYLLFATLMAVAGSMGTTQRESQQIAGLFTFSAAIPFVVIGLVFTNPNAPIAVALSYFPLTAPVMMLIRLGFGNVPPTQVAISLVVVVVGILASLWAGAKVFRVGLLMYGQRPGLRDLARAFRQA